MSLDRVTRVVFSDASRNQKIGGIAASGLDPPFIPPLGILLVVVVLSDGVNPSILSP